jgi:acetyltransferase-like isoleucine patch superfamily enzyme
MQDTLGKIIHRLRRYRLAMLGQISGFVMQIDMRLNQVQFGKGLRFWGTTHIARIPGSVIRIGSFTSFRSDKTSNPIGVNRRCIISTHDNAALISIGENCGFSGTVIGAKKKILIGNNVLFGANSLVTDFDWHDIHPERRRTSTGDSKEVIIGDNVFVGYGTVILKGVTIGTNTVIGAQSVVTKSIPANVIAGGNPCKVLRPLSDPVNYSDKAAK